MTVLYITELESLGTPSAGGNAQMPHMPPVAEQTIAIGGTSVQSAAFNKSTRFVRVNADVTCSIAIGANPTAQSVTGTNTGSAAAGTARVPANETEYFDVSAGHKIAVISTT